MWRFVLVIPVLVPLFAAMACEPGRIPEYENATSQRVTVYKDGVAPLSLGPHESARITVFEQYPLPNTGVVAEDGRVLLEDHLG